MVVVCTEVGFFGDGVHGMRILFTGASSFTGYWFVRKLVSAGYEVVAIFQRAVEDYAVIRGDRVAQLQDLCDCRFSVSYTDDNFLNFISHNGIWDLYCHHGAEVTDYRSPSFDYIGAVDRNTTNCEKVLSILQNNGCTRVVLTGSVFEQNEGCGSSPAFSPYGLSKGLTYQVYRFFCEKIGMSLSKFVIPNPFGPYEEGRFTSYLASAWLSGETPQVRTPLYIRDNIHVSLLAEAYCNFIETSFSVCHPSGYIESQGDFTARFSRELSIRWKIPCRYELSNQEIFSEPEIRTNMELCNHKFLWDESTAWDELAEYYLRIFQKEGVVSC